MSTRPRKVDPAESLRQLDGAPKPSVPYAARRARAALRENARRLSMEETRAVMAFTPEQIRVLDAIAAGLPVRNAREAVAAMRLKAEFLLPKPTTTVDHHVGIAVVDPYAEAAALAVSAEVVKALPEGQAAGEEPPPAGADDDP